MSGVFGANALQNQQYQNKMGLPNQMGNSPGMPSVSITNNIFTYAPVDSFNMQNQNMSFGGGMASGMYNPQVSGSTLQLMAQINTMMASVMQGLMSFVQVLMSSIANKQSSPTTGVDGTTGTTSSTPTTPAPAPAPSPSTGGIGSKAVDWAFKHEGKTGSQMKGELDRYDPGIWCADFVSTALNRGGGSPFGVLAGVSSIQEWGKKHGKYTEKGKGTPKKGDVVIFKGAGRSHTGLVVKVENGKVYTIEGNSSNKVAQRNYSLNDKTISGYVQVD